MKKIMILMLSLAVLFSFAACDNSSNTPSGGEEQPDDTVDTIVASTTVKKIAEGLMKVLDGKASTIAVIGPDGAAVADATDEIGIADLLAAANGNAVSKGVFETFKGDDSVTVTAADPANIVITKKLADGIDGITSPSTVTLTVSGIDTTNSDATTKDIVLQSFKYDFDIQTTSTLSESVGEYAVLSGSVSGYLVGTAKAKVDDTGKVTEFTVNSGASNKNVLVILSDDASVVSAELGDAKCENLYGLMNAVTTKTGYNSSSDAYSYAGYQKSKIDPIKTDIDTVVKVLIGTNTSGTDLKAAFTDLSASSVTTKSFSRENGGHAKLVYTVADSTKVAATASDATTLSTKTFTLDLYGDEKVTAGADSFTIDRFTLSGTFAVAGSDAEDYDFDEIVVEVLAGDARGTVSTTDTTTVSAVTDLVFTDGTSVDLTSGSVSIEDVAIGPEMVKDTTGAYVPADKPVSVTYPMA